MVMPRSLNDPVGLVPSNLSSTRQPVSSESQSDSTSGVPPSHSVTIGASAGSGIRERYSVMTPRQGRVTPARSAAGAVIARPRSRA